MKKLLYVVIVLIMILSLGACGGSSSSAGEQSSDSAVTENTQDSVDTDDQGNAETPEENVTPEVDQAGEAGNGLIDESVTDQSDNDIYLKYADMVSAYKRYYEDNDQSAVTSETPVFTNTSITGKDSIYYGLYDLDGNGTDELFIFRNDSDFDYYNIVDILQYSNGEISHVFEENPYIGETYGPYYRVNPGKNGYVNIYCHYGSMKGGWHLYRYNGKNLDYIDGFDFVMDEPYREDKDGNRTYITDEEADEIEASFEAVEIQYYPATAENIEKIRNGAGTEVNNMDNQGDGPTDITGNTKTYASEVTMDVSYDDNEYGVIKGLDANGDIIWQKETGHYPPAQLSNVCELGTANGYFYYIEDHHVVTLDLVDGSEVWKAEFRGSPAESAVLFDNDGNLYLSGYLGPDLCVIDKNGKVKLTKNSFEEDLYWPYFIQKNGDRLFIFYEGAEDMNVAGAQVTVDLNDYSVVNTVRFSDAAANPENKATGLSEETDYSDSITFNNTSENDMTMVHYSVNVAYDMHQERTEISGIVGKPFSYVTTYFPQYKFLKKSDSEVRYGDENVEFIGPDESLITRITLREGDDRYCLDGAFVGIGTSDLNNNIWNKGYREKDGHELEEYGQYREFYTDATEKYDLSCDIYFTFVYTLRYGLKGYLPE